jgi:hypothetical protein
MKSSSALRLRAVPNAARRRLVVIESGAAGLSQSGADEFDETVAIAQLPGEAPLDLTHRVLERIANAERHGRGFDAAVLLASDASDADTCSARRLLALGIAAHAYSGAPLGELLVIGSADAGAELRCRLLDLADDLVTCAEGEPLAVRVSFSAGPPETKSGVFWVPPGRS